MEEEEAEERGSNCGRTEASSGEVISNCHDNVAAPIIDLNKLLAAQSSEEECVKLRSACQNLGLFQLINHGVPDEVIGNFKRDIAEFFSQPLDAKKEYSQLPNNLEGYGQVFVVSEDQKLDWGDMMYLTVHPSDLRDLRFWPTYPASFSDGKPPFTVNSPTSTPWPPLMQSIDAYSSETKGLARCILEFMVKAIGAEPELLLGIFEEQARGMRMNYYPPCKQADKVLGLSPHTDATGLMPLLQVNDVQGLQIKKDGKWFSVNALNDALIVNIGDTLEVLSNGKFRSVEHRAVIHPNKERISVALFHYPRENLVLSPLPEFVEDGKVRYRSMRYQDFLKQLFTAKLDGKNRLEKLKLEQ
ncbi:hypothetical protein GUJ93_ZPchr0016g2544 [Zizania palustris]|uniref:Fe2OG dioxygenase domain-containing protein n=1 Tax=Zizania palustris TaxID=103762 RepID=A0A8J5W724_ZIZPA|nr:hypothetical protein GUJ93_ZPchr0016g2544 [Zizania palustris]